MQQSHAMCKSNEQYHRSNTTAMLLRCCLWQHPQHLLWFFAESYEGTKLDTRQVRICHVTRKTVTVSTVIPDATECHARSCSLHYDHIEAAALAEVLLAPRRIVLMEAIPVISCVKTCNINSKCVSKQG